MKDGYARRILKSVALVRYKADLKLTRFIRSASGQAYLLGGSCKKCGMCCETPIIKVFPVLFNLKVARWAILTWHSLVNGFEFIGEERKGRYFIFRCTHLDPEMKFCDSYATRPGMCRDYPGNLLDSTNPVFLEGCGFYALHKKAENMRSALDRLDLPEEKLRELKRRLHVLEKQ